LQIKTKIVSSITADSKPVYQEVNGTVILPPLVFPALRFEIFFEASTQNFGVQKILASLQKKLKMFY
jgi:hypothetical protein